MIWTVFAQAVLTPAQDSLDRSSNEGRRHALLHCHVACRPLNDAKKSDRTKDSQHNQEVKALRGALISTGDLVTFSRHSMLTKDAHGSPTALSLFPRNKEVIGVTQDHVSHWKLKDPM